MPLYHSIKKESFIDDVATFVLDNFSDKLDNVKIILPNSYLCSYLQKTIIEIKGGNSILPKIISIGDINPENEESFKIPSEQIGKISRLEEKTILAEIIHSYDKLGYSLADALNMAPSLANLFFELEANNIDFATLKTLPMIDPAEHWYNIYDFLEFAYNNQREKIAALNKLTPSQHQKLTLAAELSRVQGDNPYYTVIAGVIGNNKITQNFIAEVALAPKGYVILPPIPDILESEQKNQMNPEHPMYNLNKLMDACHAHNDKEQTLLRPTGRSAAVHKSDIRYVEFNNLFLEAEYVAFVCHELLASKPESKIVILITDHETKSYFTAKLIKYGLGFTDLLGQNILTIPVISLVLELAKNICQKFSLKNFISLILHPLVISPETQKLKELIANFNRFTATLQDIRSIIDNYFTDQIKSHKLRQLCKLVEEARDHVHLEDFNSILQKTVRLARSIVMENLEQLQGIDEIIKRNWTIPVHNIETFPDILRQLLSGGRIYNQIPDGALGCITIASANDATLINYDLLIYTNFVEGACPPASINSPWLSRKMMEQIGLDSLLARFGNAMYDFYLNLYNSRVIITRSLKTSSAAISLPSPFLLKAKQVLKRTLIEDTVHFQTGHDKQVQAAATTESYVYSDYFPQQISATDIETLIRAPYNFYAKKILNLRTEKEIVENPELSEFGNFFHKVVERYSKNYYNSDSHGVIENNDIDARYAAIMLEADKLLAASIFPKHTKDLWQIKIAAIAKEFVLFDAQRRKQGNSVFSEVRGEMELCISTKTIKVIAIADRIEVSPSGQAVILDYKTGAIPGKKDVLGGLSPQLMIEAMILLDGGFAALRGQILTDKLVYVKIGSSKPFIELTEIALTREDILRHKQGLISLLDYYVTYGKYQIEPNLMKYDDYQHLARRG